MAPAPPFSEPALTVLRERYLRHDEIGHLIEEPAGMLGRVAAALAEPARRFGEDRAFWEARFLERMERLEFRPTRRPSSPCPRP